MPNIDLMPYEKPSLWRKMSFGNWGDYTDPQVYGRLEVDMSAALAWAAEESSKSGEKITPTHLVVRAVALALAKYPEANVMVRWNKPYLRKNVDVFCQVAIPGERPDLSGATIRNADRKTPSELARELREKATRVRNGTDKELGSSRKSFDLIPALLSRFVFKLMGFLCYTLNLDLSSLGLPKDPFGSAMVTSIGSLGIAEAYPPLVPMSRVPTLVAVGKVEDKPVVRDGQIVIRPTCVLTATFDHRIMDGFTAGKLARFLTEYLEHPEA